MIYVTDAAREQILKAVDADCKNIYFGLAGGGCSGFQYMFTTYPESAGPDEEEFEFDGFNIIVGKKALPYLKGTTIDFKTEGLSSGFAFDNPNVKSSCGCKNSVSFEEDGCCG